MLNEAIHTRLGSPLGRYNQTYLRVAALKVLNQGLERVVSSGECSIEEQGAVVGIMRLDYFNSLSPVDVCHIKLTVCRLNVYQQGGERNERLW